MTSVARVISILLHPLFVVFYALLILLCVNPYLFSIQEPKQRILIIVSIFFLSVVFPLIAILMLRGLGFIKSLSLVERTERVGPLIIVGIFYLWLYINIRSNTLIPSAFSIFVLGATISLFVAFFINNFSKISLHTVGMGGLLGIVLLIRYFFSYETFYLDLARWGRFELDLNVLAFLIVVAAGLVGTSRLILFAHKNQEVFGGYAVGFFGQLLSFAILF